MNKEIMLAFGFGEQVARVEQGKCPMCGNKIVKGEFKNELSKDEFKISGMCQKCQDNFFE